MRGESIEAVELDLSLDKDIGPPSPALAEAVASLVLHPMQEQALRETERWSDEQERDRRLNILAERAAEAAAMKESDIFF